MEVQEINNLKIKHKGDKKFVPKTKAQITPELYEKWLTDKYIKDTSRLKHTIEDLIIRLKDFENKIKQKDSNRLKYQNEKGEFLKELYKDDLILKYKREIENLNKHIKRLRKANEELVIKNLKLENK